MNATCIFSRALPQRPLEAPENQDFQFFFQIFSIPFFSKKKFIKGGLQGKVLKPLGMALVGIYAGLEGILDLEPNSNT